MSGTNTSIFQKFIKYGRKKFYYIGPCSLVWPTEIKTFFWITQINFMGPECLCFVTLDLPCKAFQDHCGWMKSIISLTGQYKVSSNIVSTLSLPLGLAFKVVTMITWYNMMTLSIAITMLFWFCLILLWHDTQNNDTQHNRVEQKLWVMLKPIFIRLTRSRTSIRTVCYFSNNSQIIVEIITFPTLLNLKIFAFNPMIEISKL